MATPSEKCEFSQALWDLSLFLKLSHSAPWALSSVARLADFFWTLKFKSKAFLLSVSYLPPPGSAGPAVLDHPFFPDHF